MEPADRRTSRLAVWSLAVISVALVFASLGASALVWYPWRDPQGWDKLPLVLVLSVSVAIAALLSTLTGIAALIRIAGSAGRLSGRSYALAGLGLAILAVLAVVRLLF